MGIRRPPVPPRSPAPDEPIAGTYLARPLEDSGDATSYPAAVWAGPNRPSTGRALRRSWWIIAICAIVGWWAGLVVGVLRKPVYTASTLMTVGQASVTTQAVPGVVVATQSLAATYSRMIQADAVIRRISTATGVDPATVASSISASPIPDSPIVQAEATAPTADKAVRLANAARTALTSYVAGLDQSTATSARLLIELRRATTALETARAKLHRLAAQGPTPASRAVGAEIAVAQVKVQTLTNAYQQTQPDTLANVGLELLTAARGASSDRTSTLERLAITGLVAGLALGVAIGLIRAARTR